MPCAFNTRHNLYGKSYEEVSDIVFANRAQQQPPRVEPGQPHQPRRTTGAPATDKQLRFIDSLLTHPRSPPTSSPPHATDWTAASPPPSRRSGSTG